MTDASFDPTPVTAGSIKRLASLATARLSGVSYIYLPWPDELEYSGGESGVDSDLAAVELDFGDDGTLLVTWFQFGELECLSFQPDSQYPRDSSRVLDAGPRQAWRPLLGKRLEVIAASWHVSGDDCERSVWAVRLSSSQGSVVLALGRVIEVGVTLRLDYMPDELVVLFDPGLAQDYRPRHVIDRAWGVPLPKP